MAGASTGALGARTICQSEPPLHDPVAPPIPPELPVSPDLPDMPANPFSDRPPDGPSPG